MLIRQRLNIRYAIRTNNAANYPKQWSLLFSGIISHSSEKKLSCSWRTEWLCFVLSLHRHYLLTLSHLKKYANSFEQKLLAGLLGQWEFYDDHAWAKSSEINALVNVGQNRDIFYFYHFPYWWQSFFYLHWSALGHIQQLRPLIPSSV